MSEDQKSNLGKSLDGTLFNQEQAEELLSQTIEQAHRAVKGIGEALHGPWTANPTTSVRAAYGHWILASARHLEAIVTLAKMMDLAKVAEVHIRQILEVLFQIRKLASYSQDEQDKVAKKIAVWGILDYLDKLERFRDADFAKAGHEEIEGRLSRFDRILVDEVRDERKTRQLYWFGRSITGLAREVNKRPEDMGKVYRITSAQVHGSWDLALDVVSPEPGSLDFRGYQNEAQILYWAADLVDRATNLYIRTWNEVADAVGAARLNANHES